MNIAILFFSLLLLLFSVPIFMVFGLGSAGTAIWGMNLPWSTLIQVSFGAMTKHVLIAVPLFIFTGMVMLRGGAAARLVHFATTLVGHRPGGLGIAMILAMGFFAAFCGSILAAITAVGTIMIPQMVDQGYPKPFVIGLAASAAFLEALIPPSNAAILFSALTDVLLPDILTYDKNSELPAPLNGRRLEDDVIDVELRIVTGGLPCFSKHD